MKQGVPIGRLLVEMGKTTPEVIEGVEAVRLGRPLRFASRLKEVRGLQERDLLEALAVQKGLPGVVLSETSVDLSLLVGIPKDVAMESKFLPLAIEEGRLQVAFVDPDDRSLLDEITFVTGHDITPFIALQIALEDAIEGAYDAASRGKEHWNACSQAPPAGYIERVAPPGVGVPPPSMGDEMEPPPAGPEIGEEPPGSAPSKKRAGQSRPADGGRRVLAVDDEPEILQLLGVTLEREGYLVETAERGLEALEKVRDFEPEVVVLDAMLPEVHGFEICRKIRSSKRFGHVPVIMISAVYRGWRYAQDIKEVYGATEFIEKPFRIADVLAHVGRALDGAEPTQEASAEAKEQAAGAYRRGVGMLKVGKVAEAIGAFREGLGADPFSPTLHLSLGKALEMKGEAYGAITAYEKAIELSPKLYLALRNLALLYESKGFLRKAIETWEKALPNAPDDVNRKMARQRLLLLIEGGRSVLLDDRESS